MLELATLFLYRYSPQERQCIIKAIDRCGKIVSTSVLSGNDAALHLYLSEGFKIIETKTGKLNGNESFPATGHILELDKQ
ncbi:MAG TPA: hypothetical protein VK211_18245 [Kamptonema sp.]|nr:hypothetical protein [Kamptonema sp.]